MTRTTTFLTVAGIAVGSLAAYAAYFDYKRRTDSTFRKRLRKEKKRAEKSQTPSETSSSTGGVDPKELISALEKIRDEPIPTDHEERHKYFMTQVNMGETMSVNGPTFYMPAALCFYRAIRVYPSPLELIMVYEKSLSPPVFQLVMQLVNLDVKTRAEGYYNYFPRKSMNIAIQNVDVPQVADEQFTGVTMRKKVVVCTKDFEPGELIYKEEAIATALDADLQGKGTHCSHCFRLIQRDTAVRPDSDRFNSVYCSEDCHVKSMTYSQGILFTLESPLPEQLIPEAANISKDERDRAQAAFAEYIQKSGKSALELMARVIARQVSIETAQMITSLGQSPLANPIVVLTDGGDYTFNDHLERLRYLDVAPFEEGGKLFETVLKLAIPGLEHLATEERLSVYLGMMAYNAFGVCFDGGRDDKPASTARPEDMEKTRTPYGTQKQVGAGFYFLSSYLSHSCDPSARPFFDGTSELRLIATRALKAGDQVTVAYVDVSQRDDESVQDCRRRRRMELARGWTFACTCSRCASEAGPGDEVDSEPEDRSKVSEVVSRLEGV
ncbi:hypothetical protein EV363DRAFT_1393768 [Boletus edulis]|uniref:SET domain-containing protein n=1 Tax=Boletus edulis BED1 TaxID=1328754 RepID=A0AAD4C7H3_BOLED|nr:hypothetical protein EV363DRAFT_1393768 [Boletus edulis]KAF8450692.1 hypothetical protein L210DRAFT_2405211 [Boletus edulis BED1]